MHIVVLGAGYGGLRLIEKLVDRPDLRITLVDKNRYHYMQTEVYGYIAGTKDVDEIAIDLARWCRGFSRPVTFRHGTVTGLDTGRRVVTLEKDELSYDRLVIATGARTAFPASIEGLRAHSYGVKRLEKAFGFRHRFEELIERKLEGDPDPINVVVAGAGLSGVEVAAEMAYMLRRYRKSLGEKIEEISITLVDACDTILPGLHPYLIRSSLRRLRELEVIVHTSAFIERVDDRHIHLRERPPLPYTFIVFTGGIVANTEFTGDTFAKNRLGQLLVNDDLSIGDVPDLYAVGDAARIMGTDGKPLPPTAQVAEKSAEYVAKRILGKTKHPFRGKIDGLFIALGGPHGTAELFGLHFSGYGAYLLKRLVTRIYDLGIRMRANAGYRIRG